MSVCTCEIVLILLQFGPSGGASSHSHSHSPAPPFSNPVGNGNVPQATANMSQRQRLVNTSRNQTLVGRAAKRVSFAAQRSLQHGTVFEALAGCAATEKDETRMVSEQRPLCNRLNILEETTARRSAEGVKEVRVRFLFQGSHAPFRCKEHAAVVAARWTCHVVISRHVAAARHLRGAGGAMLTVVSPMRTRNELPVALITAANQYEAHGILQTELATDGWLVLSMHVTVPWKDRSKNV